uniref:hypothetical protein n=1 Tax=Nonomuraea sp. CA-251285 TaxID=3240002 RepID=UPI003F49AB7D
MNAWELYEILADALEHGSRWPWSVCVETSAPLPPIRGRKWHPRRYRQLDDGRDAYGYSRSQCREMAQALHVVLDEQSARHRMTALGLAGDLGMPPEDT